MKTAALVLVKKLSYLNAAITCEWSIFLLCLAKATGTFGRTHIAQFARIYGNFLTDRQTHMQAITTITLAAHAPRVVK